VGQLTLFFKGQTFLTFFEWRAWNRDKPLIIKCLSRFAWVNKFFMARLVGLEPTAHCLEVAPTRLRTVSHNTFSHAETRYNQGFAIEHRAVECPVISRDTMAFRGVLLAGY